MVEVAAIVAEWLTPTSLFVLLNIVIATIFFTSAFGIGTATHHGGHNNKKADHHHSETAGNPQLFRAPSLFSRVTSFNFSTHYSNNNHPYSDPAHIHGPEFQARSDLAPPAFVRAPSLLSRVTSFNFYRAQAQPEPAHTVTHVAQEPQPAAHTESKREREIEKSREEAAGESRDEEKKEVGGGDEKREGEAKKEVEVRQNTVGGRKTKAVVKTVPSRGTDEEVDAKADDFINKFKQQLKMQRLESLLRYRSPATASATATTT